jgi:Putative zinc-finger
MTCSDVDRILPDIIDGGPIEGDQDFEFQSHLRSCPDCSELVSDLRLIASESRHLSNSEEPPSRVWVRIAAELRAEGLIRDPELPRTRVAPTPPRRRRWEALWFAPVAILILAASSYLMHHKTASSGPPQVAKQSPPQQAEPPVAQHEPSSTPAAQASTAPASESSARAEVSAPPSGDDLQFLREVSERAPGMRDNYENQLQAVNHEIQETQAYIEEHPGDGDARQHLMEVLQQKAMLYQMALDRIQ